MIGHAIAVAARKLSSLGGDRDGVLARIAGPLGAEARAAVAELDKLDGGKQKLARAEWAAQVRAPVPAGFRSIHPTWIEAALAPLPPRARAAVASGGGADPVDVWLARWATASFVTMPPTGRLRVKVPDDVAGLDADSVLVWLARIGADQLAYALGPSAIGVMGSDLREALERIRQPPRAGQLGPIRAAIERCEAQRTDQQIRVVEIGANAAAPHLSPIVRRQVVARLPRVVGLGVARAFAAGAVMGLDRSPSWMALAGT
jgi:hypothetical protein